MESIKGSFIIEVDNQPIGRAEDNGEPQVHASLGPNPAIFNLIDGHLECEGWALGRSLIEDRSLLPKRVFWFNKKHIGLESIHKTKAITAGDSYELEFSGAPLIAHEGLLFADLMQDQPHNARIIMQ